MLWISEAGRDGKVSISIIDFFEGWFCDETWQPKQNRGEKMKKGVMSSTFIAISAFSRRVFRWI